MDKIYTKARAKINLTLNILNKRDDGYHNLESVFQRINLYDEIYIEKNNLDTIVLHCNIKELENENNLIYKAYVKLKEKYSTISGITVNLIKKIPMQAGIGGGSGDCASFLIAMNKLFNLNMNIQELINIGKNLGADVPPCLFKGTVKGEGIGEIITKIDSNLKFYLVIVKPELSCNTGEMYRLIDNTNVIQEYNTDKVINALETNDMQRLCNNLFNVFEHVISHKVINIKEELTSNGAIGTLLAGSGSCIFGIFENKETAKKAYCILKEKYETYICTSAN